MIKTALVPIAEGSEELEAATIIDVLRRAGVEVTVASANEGETLQISGSNGIKIVADKMLSSCAENAYDLIAVPGGLPGSEHLAEHTLLDSLLRSQAEETASLLEGACAAVTCAGTRLSKEKAPLNNQPY